MNTDNITNINIYKDDIIALQNYLKIYIDISHSNKNTTKNITTNDYYVFNNINSDQQWNKYYLRIDCDTNGNPDVDEFNAIFNKIHIKYLVDPLLHVISYQSIMNAIDISYEDVISLFSIGSYFGLWKIIQKNNQRNNNNKNDYLTTILNNHLSIKYL
jgi:hypothetical protein